MKSYEAFTLQYSPEPSGKYTTPFWFCKARTPDGNTFGDGLTPEAAMADLIVNLVQEARRLAERHE